VVRAATALLNRPAAKAAQLAILLLNRPAVRAKIALIPQGRELGLVPRRGACAKSTGSPVEIIGVRAPSDLAPLRQSFLCALLTGKPPVHPFIGLSFDSKGEDRMSKKLDAAIDALVDALVELPEHELEGWQRGNRLGLRILCELARRHPGIVQATGRFAASRPKRPPSRSFTNSR
jgi:hypothetical protein